MEVSLEFYLLALSAVFSAGVALVAWRRRAASSAAIWLAATMGFSAVWSASAAVGYTSLGLPVQQSFLPISFGCTEAVVTTLFCLARCIDDQDWRPGRLLRVALVIMPVATTAAVATNAWHHLFLTTVFLDGDPLSVRYQYGPLFWVHSAYSYLLVLAALFLLLRASVRASGPFRKQVVAILASTLFPVGGSVFTTVQGSDGTPQGSIAPLFFSVTGMIAAWALLRQGLLQLVPIARSRVVETIDDAMLVVDLEHRVLDVNGAAVRLLERLRPGIPRDMIGRPVVEVAPQGIVGLLEQGSYDQLVEPMPGLHLDVRISQVRDRSGHLLGSVVLAHDVSEMHNHRLALATANEQMREQLTTIEALRAKLAEEAIRDALTGLYNRRHLMRALDEAVEHAHRTGEQLSLLVVDIDHFKQVNDGFGHLVGDEVLKVVARCLASGARVGDTVARFGGEEFVMVLPGAGVDQAQTRAETVRARCSELSMRSVGAELSITVSVGIACLPTHADDVKGLIGAADLALYAAKMAGRNRVIPAQICS